MIYDADKIVLGVVIFLIIMTFPIWYIAAGGASGAAPEPEITTSEGQCVESVDYMRRYHMELVDEWKDMAVREGAVRYRASDGREYEINFSSTCMGCHSNKAGFCDRCHDYLGVKPSCWDCHIAPEEGK